MHMYKVILNSNILKQNNFNLINNLNNNLNNNNSAQWGPQTNNNNQTWKPPPPQNFDNEEDALLDFDIIDEPAAPPRVTHAPPPHRVSTIDLITPSQPKKADHQQGGGYEGQYDDVMDF